MLETLLLAQQTDPLKPATILILGLAFAFFYLLPTFVAWRRRKKNLQAIAVLNLLLGWLAIPWVLALVWAFVEDS